jgi:hypothetical protein
MRRTFLIAAVLAAFLSQASAQRRGGRGGYFGPGFSHFGPRARFFSNRSFLDRGSLSFNSGFISSRRFGVGWGFDPAFLPARPFRRRVFYPGIAVEYPVYPAYAYYPETYDYSSYSTSANYYSDVYYEQKHRRDQQAGNLNRELHRLSDEVEQLRAERTRAPDVPEHTTPAAEPRSTLLVFRDKHMEEIQNYAVVGQTLWTFSEQRAKRISLHDLDVPATTKVNDARGVEFVPPTTP